MKNIKNSAELHRSREEGILRKSSCGFNKVKRSVRTRMRKATGFGNKEAGGPFKRGHICEEIEAQG